MSIFLDANILFSGSNPKSNLHRFLTWIQDHETLVTSAYAVSEAERNILVKRSAWHKPYIELMQNIDIIPEAPLQIDAGLPDKDKPILGAAIAGKCTYLLTGDKRDFGHLFDQNVEGVTVINVLELTKIMLAKHTS